MNNELILEKYGIDLNIKYISTENIEDNKLFSVYSPNYGELTSQGLKSMLENINTNNKIFYDLGSGNGCLALRTLISYNFSKVIGIELSKQRHNYAINLKNQLSCIKFKNNIYFLNGDLFTFNISNADVIYISNLCFSNKINRQLGLKIQKEIIEQTK